MTNITTGARRVETFAGMLLHSTSGLYLTLFRAYDPYSGRWLSRDPQAEMGGINLYGYVDQNPVDNVDDDGLATQNKLQPDPNATGPHSSFRRGPNGQINNYETYHKNPYTGQYTPTCRYRGNGKPHGGVQPPLMNENGRARPATPQEIPSSPPNAPPQAEPPPPPTPTPDSAPDPYLPPGVTPGEMDLPDL